MWKEAAPKAGLPSGQEQEEEHLQRELVGGVFTCLFFCLFFLSPIPSVKSISAVAAGRESSQTLENTGPPSDLRGEPFSLPPTHAAIQADQTVINTTQERKVLDF